MCVTGLCFAGNLTSFKEEETWAQRGEMSCLVSQPLSMESGFKFLLLVWCLSHQSTKNGLFLSSNGPIWHFPGWKCSLGSGQWLPDLSPGHSISAAAEDVWAGKGNAAGRYKQTQVRGLERTGLLILQRSLVLVVTATPSPLQKP